MGLKKTNNKFLTSKSLNLDYVSHNSKIGIIYTLYSYKLNSIEIGFAENNKIIENKLLQSGSVLLDKKSGNEHDLNLLIKTLKELDINFSNELYCKYSNKLIRHLSSLGWPVGLSIHKQRKIKKTLSFA